MKLWIRQADRNSRNTETDAKWAIWNPMWHSSLFRWVILSNKTPLCLQLCDLRPNSSFIFIPQSSFHTRTSRRNLNQCNWPWISTIWGRILKISLTPSQYATYLVYCRKKWLRFTGCRLSMPDYRHTKKTPWTPLDWKQEEVYAQRTKTGIMSNK